jgi:diguanylate cyclase (GGDEF)-like protein/PAS domain S-box-containing protein
MKKRPDTQLFRHAMAACADGLGIADATVPDMPLIYVNPAFEQLTGYAANDVLGRNCRFLQRDDNDQAGVAAVRAALQQRTHCVVTLRNYRKDGSPFWNELTLSPIVDARGQLTHYFAQLNDVSARVSADTKLLARHRLLLSRKRELEALALRDGLTGLYNRRAFDEHLEREWNRARRDRSPLSLIMIDIDHFKRFNDTFGHPAGDCCIQEVAGAVRRCFARASDLAARYGGDEFVVLASATDRRQAQQGADRLRQSVRSLALATAGNVVTPVTLSVGVASAFPRDGGVPGQLLDAADRALYQFKRQRRNGFAPTEAGTASTRRPAERIAAASS